MKKIYCISGLGSDEKAFAKIKVDGYELKHINWLAPQINEPINEYAKRMAAAIDEENPILMGLSFGGIMSIEIAKHISVKKIILVSSIKTHKEMPAWMKIAGVLKLNKILPLNPSTKLLEPIQNYHIGASTKEEKEIVNQYRKKVQQDYLEWSVNVILNWKNTEPTVPTIHIHGNRDRIFPVKKANAQHIIDGGTHFMIFTKAKEVNAVLKETIFDD